MRTWLAALEYHTAQTRPILETEQAITSLRAAITQAEQAPSVSDKAVNIVGNELARKHAVYLTKESVRDLLTKAGCGARGAGDV